MSDNCSIVNSLSNPFQRQVIAGGVERERGRQSPEAAFGEAPQESVCLQVKWGTLAISIAPNFREPGDVMLGVGVVRDRVEGIGGGETDRGRVRAVGFNLKLRVGR